MTSIVKSRQRWQRVRASKAGKSLRTHAWLFASGLKVAFNSVYGSRVSAASQTASAYRTAQYMAARKYAQDPWKHPHPVVFMRTWVPPANEPTVSGTPIFRKELHAE